MALKPANFPIILEVQDYITLMGIPDSKRNDQGTLNRLKIWIEQATNQFDSFISGNNEMGSLYRWWESLKDNPIDNQKGLKLQRAIASWVETFIQNGKFWVDGVPTINANFNVDIQTSSENSNVEAKRLDIIQDLVAIGLYKTSNISRSNQGEISDSNLEDLIVVSQRYLDENFVRRTPQFPLSGPLSMSSNEINEAGNIVGQYRNATRPILQSFKFKDCDFGEIDNATTADKILDPINNIYRLINQFDATYFGGLTKEQIYYAISQANILWQSTIPYAKDYVVEFEDNDGNLRWAKSLIATNTNNNPNTSPNAWYIFPTVLFDISLVIEQLQPFIVEEIERQIDELDSIDEATLVKTSNPQTINGAKTFGDIATFNNDIKMVTSSGPRIVSWYKGSTRIGYIGKETTGDDNLTYEATVGKVELRGRDGVDVFNKEIFNVKTPTTNGSAAPKSYVDGKAATKQDTLTAGPGIAISSDNVISTTGGSGGSGGSGGTALLAEDNTFSGTNTFGSSTSYTLVQIIPPKGTHGKIDWLDTSTNTLKAEDRWNGFWREFKSTSGFQFIGKETNRSIITMSSNSSTESSFITVFTGGFTNEIGRFGRDKNNGNDTVIQSLLADVNIKSKTNKINVNNAEIKNVATPTESGSAANKAYVDGKQQIKYATMTTNGSGDIYRGNDRLILGFIPINTNAFIWAEVKRFTYNGEIVQRAYASYNSGDPTASSNMPSQQISYWYVDIPLKGGRKGEDNE